MDKANWTPEEAVQLARELNNYGTHYRNAVACLYKMFTLTAIIGEVRTII